MAAPRGKKKIKREKISKSKKATDSVYVEPDSASYVLTNFPLILQYIFEHFPARTLNTCGCVCLFWKETADRVLKLRSPFYWDFFTENEDEAEKAGYNDPIFFMLPQILKSIKRMPIQPKIVIIFMSEKLAEKIEDYATHGTPDFLSDLVWRLSDLDNPMVTCQDFYPPGRTNDRLKRNHFNLVEWFEYQMPFDCHVSAVVTDGVIGTFWDSCRSFENEFEGAFSFFCCSQDDEKVSLIPVDFDEKLIYSYLNTWISQPFDFCWNLFDTDYEVKKIMFFKDYEAEGDVALALSMEYGQALVAGAVVESLEFPFLLNCPREIVVKACCIAFCGENVKVASVVIDSVTRLSQLEDYMKELKSHGLPEEKSIAFMFASVCHGYNQYSDDHVQSTCFRKYFPKTPIFGTFVREEVGFNFPKTVPENVEPSDFFSDAHYEQLHSKLYHRFNSVLCLVSFQ